jgi:NAD(P)-dependent dehydrogenase (short-subunit alcohol dehydrogenase family)
MQDVQSGPPYGMTKAAIIQFTKHLAAEWSVDQIRINAISPWYIETPLTEPVLTQPDRLEKILARTPLGRLANLLRLPVLPAIWLWIKVATSRGRIFRLMAV